MTVALWFKVNSNSSEVKYLLDSSADSAGFSLTVKNEELRAIVISLNGSSMATGSIYLFYWHHVAITWRPNEGLVALLDFKRKLQVTPLHSENTKDTNGELKAGSKSNLKNSADVDLSNVAIWEKRLTSSEVQKIARCAGLTSGKRKSIQ